MVTGGLLFIWINTLLALLVARLVRRLLPRAHVTTIVLAWLVVFVATADLCLLGLGTIGFLRPLPLGVLVTLLYFVERVVPAGVAASDGRVRRVPSPATSGRIALALVGGLTVWWGVHTIAAGVGFVWDDLAYHAAIPAWWLREAALTVPPLTYQSYYPANAELFSVWFLLPFGRDAYANLTVFTWVALVLAACAVITRGLGHSAPVACAAMTCFLVSPEVRFFAGTFCANDLAVAGLGAATLALAWTTGDERIVPRALLCGVAAGLALGTKVSMAPLVLLVGIYWALHARRPGGSWRAVAAYAAGALLLGSFWYVRNAVLTGNPLFPADIGPFEGPFTAEAQRKTTLIPSIVEGATSVSFWMEFVRRRLDWPLPLGVVALAGYASGAWASVREPDARTRLYRFLLLAAGLTFLVLFPFQPFSGTNNRPTTELNHLIRYLAFPFGLGLMLLPSMVRGRPRVA